MPLVEHSFARPGIVLLTLNRPHRLNAFNLEMLRELRDALHDFDLDNDAAVAIVCGSGRAFCSGVDVDDLAIMKSRADFDSLREMQSISHFLFSSSNWKPVISAVHGYVLGMALEFVFQTDYVVADARTLFQVSETNVGVSSGLIWPILSHRGAGGFASDVCISGRFFDALEAQRSGLVAAVAPSEAECLNVAMNRAEQLARLPRESVKYNVQVSRHYAMQYVESALSFSEANFHLTPDPRQVARSTRRSAGKG